MACNPQPPTLCNTQQPDTTTYYVYSSPPKPVWGRPIYRNNVKRPRGIHDYYNVMWDPRVRRGDPLRRAHEKQAMKDCLEPKKLKRPKKQIEVPGTPPPVSGRKHWDGQTENYLEDLEGDVTEFSVKTQTEAVHELPVNPWFTPAKLGEDKSTEILPGDLFQFDLEVRPIVESLVGKVVEQALLEVMEEDELQSLIRQQNEFEERRRLEQVRLFRLQEREQRVAAEKERLMKEMAEELRTEGEAQERIGANAFAAIYLTRATGTVLNSLRSDGFLNTKSVIAGVFVPWLNCEIEHVLSKENLARSLLDDMIHNTVTKREAEYAAGIRAEPEERGEQEFGGEGVYYGG